MQFEYSEKDHGLGVREIRIQHPENTRLHRSSLVLGEAKLIEQLRQVMEKELSLAASVVGTNAHRLDACEGYKDWLLECISHERGCYDMGYGLYSIPKGGAQVCRKVLFTHHAKQNMKFYLHPLPDGEVSMSREYTEGFV